ncbi:flavin reductase (DIM6/NTAB) family NADH-FMN oxidoreductase RutF [Saccharothrix tamanrassetensis]|uniref:Flavin reductase (DIM6/NTAB) family NADH-FMN oxidoreductase RutF n=1 Tax=Saccharothrix tamanrassetensis TaxID=1051531 RepID=A0A841CRD7_9PSEU|nr:flavin reductase family protein [Saccharothrix tamanrassetensis]MBB5960291.1 flavin reductase (DIM6/NTAB) family NADH-FMN oxidoreductase RutF [Saccharothrix tamanrassetensis]
MTDLRTALRDFPQAVGIVTATGPDGPVGVTVSSFTSASLRPPLIVVWIGEGASAWPVLRTAPLFAVHLLHAGQTALSDLFAKTGSDRFGPDTNWQSDVDGVPHLLDAPVRLRCRTARRISVGDHVALVGEPLEIQHNAGTPPLVRFQGRYTSVA